MSIRGSGVTSVFQFLAAFDSDFPSTGIWYPLSAYTRSDGKSKGRETDQLLGRGGHNNRDPEASAPTLSEGGGPVRVPACLREFGFWLTVLLGAPETTGSGPYTHVWESGKEDLKYLAQSKRFTDTWYERTRGLVADTLAINLEKKAGFDGFDLNLMLLDVTKAGVQASGTIADPFELLRVPASMPFVKRNGVAAPTTAFSLNYANGLERYDPLNGNEFPAALDPGEATIGGSFTVRLADATFDDLAEAETKEPWQFGWVKTNGLGVGSHASLTFELTNVSIGVAPKAVTGRGRLFQTYNFVAEQSADDPAMTVTLVNDVSGYPPPPPPPPPPP
ncbi:MAG TPA: phage tail tube protein [Vitreimonas sp.]|uniref:phage tail tube protein n=1 Tax=Vitreimonas sp. TaxID=3069702 RepID=UPI002D6B0851|nr:phage tail tube protein [Vitreimonas sp.]HYD87113.1 phage tail tube protein [Vitreimonas sp.]